ncbi:hypothetical protein CU100_03335 [Phyllobacterium endophyticum]|uniref:Uncharacterized protein n=1 Tax=Phyllobacterium endophyticum TaxID=1149773 RepID=A0A2P7B007_9HYPH|nr:hypothetical protein CU100_03335 [Phyllobacterium endophyticum]
MMSVMHSIPATFSALPDANVAVLTLPLVGRDGAKRRGEVLLDEGSPLPAALQPPSPQGGWQERQRSFQVGELPNTTSSAIDNFLETQL